MTAKQLIEQFIEFYGSGPLPMMDPGSVGCGDGVPGASDSTNFDKRRKYLDAEEGAWSCDGSGSERDIGPSDITPRAFTPRKTTSTPPYSQEFEDFGLAGLPGGVRDDPESPNDYDSVVQARLR